MSNKIKKLIITIIFLLLIFILTNYINELNKQNFVYIRDLKTYQNLTDEFIYFGRPTFPTCELFEPLLKEVVKEEDKQVYYFDIDYFRNNSIISVNELNTILEKNEVLEIPMLIKLEHGIVQSSFSANILNSENTEILKVKVREFLNYELFPAKYIPHYNLIIAIFAISVFLAVFEHKIKKNEYTFVALLMTYITSIYLLIFTIQASVKYIDYYGYSGIPIITCIFFLSMIINIFFFLKLIINRIILKKC